MTEKTVQTRIEVLKAMHLIMIHMNDFQKDFLIVNIYRCYRLHKKTRLE